MFIRTLDNPTEIIAAVAVLIIIGLTLAPIIILDRIRSKKKSPLAGREKKKNKTNNL